MFKEVDNYRKILMWYRGNEYDKICTAIAKIDYFYDNHKDDISSKMIYNRILYLQNKKQSYNLITFPIISALVIGTFLSSLITYCIGAILSTLPNFMNNLIKNNAKIRYLLIASAIIVLIIIIIYIIIIPFRLYNQYNESYRIIIEHEIHILKKIHKEKEGNLDFFYTLINAGIINDD